MYNKVEKGSWWLFLQSQILRSDPIETEEAVLRLPPFSSIRPAPQFITKWFKPYLSSMEFHWSYLFWFLYFLSSALFRVEVPDLLGICILMDRVCSMHDQWFHILASHPKSQVKTQNREVYPAKKINLTMESLIQFLWYILMIEF